MARFFIDHPGFAIVIAILGASQKQNITDNVVNPTSAPPLAGGIGFRAGFDARCDATPSFSVVRFREVLK